MDFITCLPRTRRQHDSIWVIVYSITKSSRFLAVKTTDSAEDYAKLNINEIVRFHGVPLSIISDRGPQFTSHSWKSFQKGLGTHVNLSTTFHPQTDGQAERTIQTLEDMLRACVIDFKGSWDDHLPLIEFAYNNRYHSSIQMAPYEALYWHRCRSPVGWFEVGEAALIGPDSVLDAMEKVKLIRDRLKTAQSRQKSYADVRRRELEFQVDDWVFLKVSPMKGLMTFGKKGKVSPRYVGPYRILKRIGKVAYELELRVDLAAVHPVFHISLLKKCVGDPASIVPLESMAVKDRLSYEDVPVEILDRRVRSVFACSWNSVQLEIQFSVFSGGTHGNHSRIVDGLTARPAGPWFVTENIPRTQSENLAKSRLTDRPTVRRSDHGPWSVSVDRDFPYPASDTYYSRPAWTVNRSTVHRSDQTPFTALAPPVFKGECYHVLPVRMKVDMEANDLWEAIDEDNEVPPLLANHIMAQIRNNKEKKTRK
ncbi:hypothetical protein MTR67_002428 [Solanum verrucosum]|uniref:Integrase catalytic domain-containing protein n=1 Tax=Solanum verrucosum TaxID=315347 RepID=A0AAF0PPY1_SOLVR|nr:hypothetical protein MTR67_002428 [Solanum verrucosum]